MGAFSKRRVRAFLLRYAIGRLLYFDLWFRVACGGVVFLLVFLALFVSRIWTVSPRGFLPIVRVSGLDVAQAHSLARAAKRAMAEGQFERAHYTWLASIANNAADPALIRGALNCYLRDPDNNSRTEIAIQQVFWLLRLTATNEPSLELGVEIFANARQFDLAVSMLGPREGRLNATLRAAYLKALFEQEQFGAFGRAYRQWESALPHDPVLALYRAAFRLGWGDPAESADSRRQLEAAIADPVHRVLSARLQLKIASRHMDLDRCADLLVRLGSWKADRLEDHMRYWALTADLGFRDRALAFAREHPREVASVKEAAELTRFYWKYDAHDEALHFLKELIPALGNSPQFWILYAGKLLEAEQWSEAERVAFQIRNRNSVGDLLAAFSYFLEGQANMVMQRNTAAERAFGKMLEWEFRTPELGLAAASHLLQAGQATVARGVLRKLEPALQHRSDYWMLLFQAAHQMKNTELMVSASRRALQLAPSDPVIRNNHAAALLSRREQSDEAIRLTFPLLSDHPNSLVATVNHGVALLMNGRFEDAEVLLQKVPQDRLTRSESALVNLSRFEIHLRRQQYEEAWRTCDQIDRDLLYPDQERWLADACAQMPPRGDLLIRP